MSLKLLIDECLSPSLVEMALTAGHHESTCVLHRGWTGEKDWDLIQHVIAGDFTLVTHNARKANPESAAMNIRLLTSFCSSCRPASGSTGRSGADVQSRHQGLGQLPGRHDDGLDYPGSSDAPLATAGVR
jgi:hypothetical protein